MSKLSENFDLPQQPFLWHTSYDPVRHNGGITTKVPEFEAIQLKAGRKLYICSSQLGLIRYNIPSAGSHIVRQQNTKTFMDKMHN